MTRNKSELFYDRDTLYSEVWECTLANLCKKYDVSHSALVKACEILNVPRPLVGYWTQKELGKAPAPSPLPSFDNPPSLLIHPPEVKKESKSIPVKKINPQGFAEKPKLDEETKVNHEASTPDSDHKIKPLQDSALAAVREITNWRDLIPKEGIVSPQVFEDAIQLIEKEALPEMAIIVPVTAKKEHPYVKNTRLELERRLKNKSTYRLDYGRIKCNEKDIFDIDVGPDSVQRVLNILQSLCDAFEKRGFALVSEWNENNRYGHIYVMVMGEKITFSIAESSKKVKLEKKENSVYSDYEYIPTGKLTLQNLYPPYQMNGQYRWSDTKKILLEEKLNDVVAGFIFASAWEKEREVRKKIEEENEKRKEAIRREKERLARIEKQRIVNFKKGTEYWVLYQNMAAFLTTVKKSYKKSAKKNDDTKRWIRWATNYLTQYKTKFEEMVHYDVEEYNEYKEKAVDFRPIYNPPPEEPYNYWRRPWYQRRK